MAYGLKYRADWTNNAGGKINWRLDIEQFNYTGTVDEMVCAGEPVEIEYVSGQDIYDPIIGSKATINLLVTDDQDYDDFSILMDAGVKQVTEITLNTNPSGGSSLQVTQTDGSTATANVLWGSSINNSAQALTTALNGSGTGVSATRSGGVVTVTWDDAGTISGTGIANLPSQATAATDTNGAEPQIDPRAYRVTLRTREIVEQITQPLQFEGNQLMIGDVLRIVSSGTYTGEVEMTVRDTNSSDPAERISQTNLESVLEVGDFIVVDGERYEVLFIGAFSDGVDARLIIDKESISGLSKNDDLLLETQAGSDVASTYWRGFITPQDGGIAETTTPYPIALTATDGLNLVNSKQVVPYADEDPTTSTRCGEYLFDLVNQTGTQLDVRCYSDLRTTINSSTEYAIIETELNDQVFFDSSFLNPKSIAEAARSVLNAFNARMFQSDGVWCIISNSGHSATISNNAENIPFKLYTYDSDTETWDNGTENTSTNRLVQIAEDFLPVNQDLVIINRRPYFSIENKVSEQNGTAINANAFFSDAPGTFALNDDENGPIWINEGVGPDNDNDSANYGTSRPANSDSTETRLGTNHITTTRTNDNNGHDNRDIWFEVNIPFSELSTGRNQITIAMEQKWTDSVIAASKIGVCVAIQTGDESVNEQYLVYNWETEGWFTAARNFRTSVGRFWTHLETKSDQRDQLNFFNVDFLIDKVGLADWANQIGIVGGLDDTDPVKIRIGDIKGYDQEDKRIDTNGDITTNIDAVIVSPKPDNKLNPFYERYQHDTNGIGRFSETLQYETDLYSEGDAGFRGKLSQDNYFRNGKSESLSLEKIVTQQKLNDYRTALKTYEGTIIGITADRPLHLVDKLRNNQTGGDTESTILRHFSLQTKANQYRFQSYLPNQSDDIPSDQNTFTTEDVFPLFQAYDWRETNITHDIELDLSNVTLPSTGGIETNLSGATTVGETTITVDDTDDFPDSGWLEIGTNHVRYTGKGDTTFTGIPEEGEGSVAAHADNTLVKAGVPAYINTGLTAYKNADDEEEYAKYLIRYFNAPELESLREEVNLEPTDDTAWEINGSNFSLSNDDNEIMNEFIFDTGTGVRLSFETETKDYSNEITVEVSGEIDALATDTVTYTVTKGDEPSGVLVTVADGGTLPAGSTEYLLVYYTPTASDKEITVDNATITATAYDSDDNELSDVIGTIAETAFGTGVQYIIPITHNEDLDDIGLSFTATTSDLGSQQTSTITLNCSEAGDDASNWSLQDTQLTATGVVGTTVEFVLEVNADDGYIITAVSAGSTEESEIDTIRNKHISDTEWLTFVKCTFGGSNSTITITLDATTSDDDGEEVNHTITTPDAGSGWSYTQNEDVVVGVDPGDTARVTVTIEGDDGYDVSGVEFAVPDADTWLELESISDYKVNGSYTSGKNFHFKITGQTDAQDSTITTTGSAVKVETIDLVMQLDTSDSGIASINKSHLKWTYSEADAGTAGEAMTFTVQSNDPTRLYTANNQFSAGEHYVEGTQSGSSSVGTFVVEKGAFQGGSFVADVTPNDASNDTAGQFAFRVTPTFGSAIPADGRYDGYFVLEENSPGYAIATEGQFENSPYLIDRSARSGDTALKIGWRSNGTVTHQWISGADNASFTNTMINESEGYLTVTLPAVTSDTTRNIGIFPSNDFDDLSDYLGSVHISQRANNATQVDGNDIEVVSSLPSEPNSSTIYIVTT